MPIQVSEVVIKAVVGNDDKQARPVPQPIVVNEPMLEKLIEEVIKKIKRKNER